MSDIHATAIIEKGAVLGAGVKIGPYCIVSAKAVIGERTQLRSHVVVSGITRIGPDCIIHPFAALGGPPQHTRYKGEDVELIIGARNVIRESVTMNAGTPFGLGKTVVGDDCMFMIASHVAHDCMIGNQVIFTNNAVVGGHVEVGDYAMIGGNSAVHQFVRIGTHAFVGGMSGLEGDLIPYGSCLGDRAELAGFNIVGLKRRGFSRETIHKMRAAYRVLFGEAGNFESRVAATEAQFSDVLQVREIVQFIRSGNHRALCRPRGRVLAARAQDDIE